MSDWMISLLIGAITFIAMAAVVRHMVSQHAMQLGKHADALQNMHAVPDQMQGLKVTVEALDKRLDKHGDDIVAMRTEASHNLTAEKADDLYLRIKEFERFEKHIDIRFDMLQAGQEKILDFIEKRKNVTTQ